jgi:acyl-CoA reductase-like NAD-dependent aldehyde dehydrogenase
MSLQIKPGKLFINGKWQDSVSGETFNTVNPATGEIITQVARGNKEDVDLAVKSARKSFEEGPWASMSVSDRGKILWKIGDLVDKYNAEISEVETLDNGKPIFESSKIDIPLVAEIFRYYAGWATKIHGETIPVKGNFFNYTLREPIGVVGAIVPWNFPLLLASWKIAPALACGNTVILKPAEITSLSALKFAEICQEAGLPDGVLNIITGPGSVVGNALVEHPGVDKIAFTGSTEVGKEIMRRCAGTLKKVSLELGGKSPNIVFADADIDSAIRGAFNGIFYGKGEVCAAGSRLFVEEKIHDEFITKLIERTKKAIPGDPLNPKTRLGAIVSKEQMDKVLSYIEIGKKEGAKLVAGGEKAVVEGLNGNFVYPTVFDEVDNKMRIAQEEIFGPVLSTIIFKDINDAIEKANSTIYGLASAVWTRDVKKAHHVVRKIKAGTVWINTYNNYDPAAPFGGYKMSGFGRELGMHALDLYTQIKNVMIDLNE